MSIVLMIKFPSMTGRGKFGLICSRKAVTHRPGPGQMGSLSQQSIINLISYKINFGFRGTDNSFSKDIKNQN